MTSQREVIEAFFQFETTPRSASNMEILSRAGGSRGWLIGGRGGGSIVIAEREPLREVTVYGNRWSARGRARMYNSAGVDQVATVVHVARDIADDVSARITVDTDADVINISDHDDLEQDGTRLNPRAEVLEEQATQA